MIVLRIFLATAGHGQLSYPAPSVVGDCPDIGAGPRRGPAGQPGGGAMRKVPLAGAAAALVLGLAGVLSISAASPAAGPSPAKSKTLVFDVVFSPFTLIKANNARNPHSPFALGDEVVEHDQLFSHGQHVGHDVVSCVIVALTPQLLNNCSAVFTVPGGEITTQFATGVMRNSRTASTPSAAAVPVPGTPRSTSRAGRSRPGRRGRRPSSSAARRPTPSAG
jgi:hypothetical protein